MYRRGVRFLSFMELKDLVLVSLQCPWLVRRCRTRANKQRRQDQILPPLPTPGVTICRSDGACRGQGTNAETHAGWGTAVWSADDRGLGAGVAFAIARGFLGMITPTTTHSSHVIFLGLIVLKITLLSINNVFMFVIPFQLFTSRGIFVIFIVSSTRPQIHYLIRRLMSVIRMVLRHLVMFTLRTLFTFFFSLLHPFCQISELLSNVRSCARV